jgi:hypothetical protein
MRHQASEQSQGERILRDLGRPRERDLFYVFQFGIPAFGFAGVGILLRAFADDHLGVGLGGGGSGRGPATPEPITDA